MSRVEPYVKVQEVIKDFPTMLSVDGNTNLGCVIVSEVGPKLAYVTGPDSFLKLYTKDGQTIPRNAHISFINAYYLSFVAGLVIARSVNSEVVGGIKVYVDGTNHLQYQPTLYNGEVELRKKMIVGLALAQSSTAWGIMINDVLYYAGTLSDVITGVKALLPENDKVLVDSMPAVNIGAFGTTITDQIDALVNELNTTGEIVATATATGLVLYWDNNTSTPVAYTSAAGTGVALAQTNVFGYTLTPTTPTAQDIYDDPTATLLFEVISKTAGNVGSNPYKVTVGASGSDTYKQFDLTLDGETFKVSLNPDSVDASGINNFIEVINTYPSSNFTIKDAGTSALATAPTWEAGTQRSFGEGFVNTEDSMTTACMKSALDVLDDQELYRIHGLASLGITTVQFVKTMCSLGEKRKWFTPWDVPYDRVNYSSISAYGANMPDSNNNMGIGPFDKNSGLTGWMNYIAATTLYWERVMRNKALRSEFAPVFENQSGLMAYTNPVKLITKSVREKLLSLSCPINYVIFSETDQSYFLNDNFTHYSKEDITNEECNVRMAHKISNDIEVIMRQFKAKYNNEQTRQNVYDLITLYFQENIMNQNYKPEEFMIVCDRTNNTDQVINAGKLALTVKIRMYHSIKYIVVTNELYSVGGSAMVA